jgi:sRNA-binding protein
MTTELELDIVSASTEEAVELAPAPELAIAAAAKPGRGLSVQPVLEKLFELYPHLFGAEFLPLKLGIFQELLALHPDFFPRDALKAALGVHTRSTRYLQCVAAGKQRHDLQGAAVEAVAPEHVYWAILELFRRRQARSAQDLRPKLRSQLLAAFEASGLTRQDYLTRVQTKDADSTLALEDAFAELDQRLARQEALRTAYENSGKTVAEFADMYGMDRRDVTRALEGKRRSPVGAEPV